MHTINAYSSAISQQYVKAALSVILEDHKMLPAKAVMHSSQVMALFLTGYVNPPANIGIQLVEDCREPMDRIQFKDADDVVLAEIVNLAIPLGFDYGRTASQPKPD